MAEALGRAEGKAAAHGKLFLVNQATSQRVQVLGSLRACSGRVLLVSAFLNAPPSPELGAVAALEATLDTAEGAQVCALICPVFFTISSFTRTELLTQSSC